MENTFYFITVFAKYDDRGPHNMRCWGFYTNIEDAIKTLDQNVTDLWETIYDYAIIEEYLEGIGGYNWKRQFFKYDNNLNSYRPIREPEELKHYVGFALG